MLKPRRISSSHRDAFLERYKVLHAWAVQMTANDHALAEDLLHDLFILFTLSQPNLQAIENLDNSFTSLCVTFIFRNCVAPRGDALSNSRLSSMSRRD